MRSFLQGKKYPFLGIDIQSDEVRLVELREMKQAPQIAQAGAVSLPPHTIVEGKVQQAAEISTAVLELLCRTQTKRRLAAIALPAQAAVSKQIQLAVELTPAECEAEIFANLNHYFPNLPETLCCDYWRIDSPQTDWQQFLLVVARASQVQAYVAAVEQVGVSVSLVELDIYALLRSIQFAAPVVLTAALSILLKLDSQSGQFIILQHSAILFHQTISFKNAADLCHQLHLMLQLCLATQRNLADAAFFIAGNQTHFSVLSSYLQKEWLFVPRYVNLAAGFFYADTWDADWLGETMPISLGLALRRRAEGEH